MDKAGVDPPNHWTFSSVQKKYVHFLLCFNFYFTCPGDKNLIYFRYEDLYELTVEYKDGITKSTPQTGQLKESVTKYFDEKGNLREDLFHPRIKQLCKNVQSKKSK